jgi:hypothetical protein
MWGQPWTKMRKILESNWWWACSTLSHVLCPKSYSYIVHMVGDIGAIFKFYLWSVERSETVFLCDRWINKAHQKRKVLIFQCTKSIIRNHSPYSYMTSHLLVQVLTYKIWWASCQSIQLKKDNKGENNYTSCLTTCSTPPLPKKRQKEF